VEDLRRATDGSASEEAPLPRPAPPLGGSSGLCGDGYGGRGAKISTLDGFLGAPRGGGARNRLLGCWQRCSTGRTTRPGSMNLAERVQLFRRSFGLTLLIGLWYEPVQRPSRRSVANGSTWCGCEDVQLRERVMTT
jgi:hypothetical protein